MIFMLLQQKKKFLFVNVFSFNIIVSLIEQHHTLLMIFENATSFKPFVSSVFEDIDSTIGTKVNLNQVYSAYSLI